MCLTYQALSHVHIQDYLKFMEDESVNLASLSSGGAGLRQSESTKASKHSEHSKSHGKLMFKSTCKFCGALKLTARWDVLKTNSVSTHAQVLANVSGCQFAWGIRFNTKNKYLEIRCGRNFCRETKKAPFWICGMSS